MRHGRPDDGMAMAAALAFVAVALVVTVMVATSVTSAQSVTMTTRTNVAAQAAAESGLAVARAGLGTAACSGAGAFTGTVGGSTYSAIAYGSPVGAETWTASCDPPAAGEVRIVSAGSADGETITIEARLGTLEVTETVEEATGPAAFVGSGSSVNAFTITVPEGVAPGDLRIANGNLNCSTASRIEGSVYIAAGGANLTNTCQITGSLYARDSVNLDSSARVDIDVISATASVSLQNSSRVGGNVTAATTATLNGSIRVGGSVLAAGTGQLMVNPDARVTGGITTGGYLNSWVPNQWTYPGTTDAERAANALVATGRVGGPILQQQTGLTAPAAPTAPPWTVWTNYTAAKWLELGYTEIFWPSGICTVDANTKATSLAPILSQIQSATAPIVVNALSCGTLDFTNNAALDLRFHTNVAFVSNGFSLGAMTLDSADSTHRLAMFLIPDLNPGAALPHGGSFQTYQAVRVGDHLAAIVYTPGTASINNQTQWRGQLYTGALTMSAGDGLVYLPVGVPGMNLDDGTPAEPTVEVIQSERTLVYQRTLNPSS